MSDPTPAPTPEVEEPAPQPVATVPVAEPVPTEPVTGEISSASGAAGRAPARRRRRWILALGAVAMLLGATAVGAVMLAGASSDDVVARWAPADTVVYGELRADLPGDQRAALGELLSAFPGFADQASLDRKLTELYDQLVDAASEGKQSWSEDIATWFGGRLGVAAGPLPDITSLDDPTAAVKTARALLIASVDDAAAAMAWVRATVEAAGGSVRTGDADGTELLLIGPEDHPAAAATTGGVLLAGDEASVRAALARNGQDGLATVDAYDEAIGSIDGQQAAVGYVDAKAYLDWALSLPTAAESGVDMAQLAALLPDWMAAGLRIEPDALVGSTVAPVAPDQPVVEDTASELPALLPATTAVLAEGHGASDAFADGWEQGLQNVPEEQRQAIEDALRLFGGLEGIVGWMGEVGFVLLADGATAQPGVVAIPTDAVAAENLGRTVANTLTLAGLEPTEETYAGATIVSIDVSDLTEDATIFARPIRPSWAVTDDLVVVGLEPSFVKAVLDVEAGDSLADRDDFKALLDRAGREHRALAYADIDALEALIVGTLPADELARYESDIKPYFTPFDALIGVAERDGDLHRTRSLLVIEQGQ